MLEIVIPAYEPDEKLLILIDSLKNTLRNTTDFDILIINDGSSSEYDTIFTAASKKGCRILSHRINQGKGAALKTGFSYLLNSGFKGAIVCADCDGQHRPSDILKVSAALKNDSRLLVLGCRDFIGKIPLKSIIGNKLTSLLYTMISGQNLKDTQTGLRAFSSELLPWLLQINGNRYEYEMNQLLEAKDSNIVLQCIPIETIYENRNEGTHFHPVKDSFRIYLPIFKYLFSSLLAGSIDFILLFLFMKLTNNLLFSVVISRMISSVINFLCNKQLVFNKSKVSTGESFVKYYLLAGFMLLCNYYLIRFFTFGISLPLTFSKIVTEVLLFLLSYKIQKNYIFKKNKL
ncbi:bifunctional glycosyltransferase family 2/GtrA family protein [Anaerocolumna sp. AGMB13020]|uniref:bifunctional glycosyltransferase family 2/GtrA family protein n=1 Tax=Anaerocolumna sp. AGMB13020 TaxID=3081750 RepID=UPI0029549C3B|nr:bifunctional glycosyltransferase family 2/GtrA family protein [Anaerocolumna sp. AGMB13020]WOO36222.1 bifunctional glycosyltransferase family 2/GtrA family protein [Anaerocolumna sp. AGMB13020]